MAAKLDFATLTLQDALDLTVLIEKEAEERYRLFVSQLGGGEDGDAVAFFAMMERNEQRHCREPESRQDDVDMPARAVWGFPYYG